MNLLNLLTVSLKLAFLFQIQNLSKAKITSLSYRGKHSVGRIDIVENRFIGMKSRGTDLKIRFNAIHL